MDKMQKIRQEIERRMDKHWEGLPDADSPEDNWTHNELCELGAYKELEHIEDFLNSLQKEQPEVDLEKELQAFLCNYDYEFDDDAPASDIARHFYELGKKGGKV